MQPTTSTPPPVVIKQTDFGKITTLNNGNCNTFDDLFALLSFFLLCIVDIVGNCTSSWHLLLQGIDFSKLKERKKIKKLQQKQRIPLECGTIG